MKNVVLNEKNKHSLPLSNNHILFRQCTCRNNSNLTASAARLHLDRNAVCNSSRILINILYVIPPATCWKCVIWDKFLKETAGFESPDGFLSSVHKTPLKVVFSSHTTSSHSVPTSLCKILIINLSSHDTDEQIQEVRKKKHLNLCLFCRRM